MIKRLFWLTLTIVLLSALFACAATAASMIVDAEGNPIMGMLYLSVGDSKQLSYTKDGVPVQNVTWTIAGDGAEYLSVDSNGRITARKAHPINISQVVVWASDNSAKPYQASIRVKVLQYSWNLTFAPAAPSEAPTYRPGEEAKLLIGTISCDSAEDAQLFAQYGEANFIEIAGSSQTVAFSPEWDGDTQITCYAIFTPGYGESGLHTLKGNRNNRLENGDYCASTSATVDGRQVYIRYTLAGVPSPGQGIGSYNLQADYAIVDADNQTVSDRRMTLDSPESFRLICNNKEIPLKTGGFEDIDHPERVWVEWTGGDEYVEVDTLTGVVTPKQAHPAGQHTTITATTEDGGSASFNVTVTNNQYEWRFERSGNSPTLKPDASEWKVLLGTVECTTPKEAELCRVLFTNAEYSSSGSLKIPLENGKTQKALLKPEAKGTTVSFYAVVEPKYLPSGTYNIQWDGSLTDGCAVMTTMVETPPYLVNCALDLGNNPQMGAFTLEAQYAIWDDENSPVTALTMEVGDQSKQFALACNGAAIPEGVTVTWTGGDQYVAVNDGEITPKKAHAEGGSTTITAATQDGGSASFTVTVSEPAPPYVPPYVPPAPAAPSSIQFTPAEDLPAGLELKQGERVTLELGVIDNYAAFAAAGVEVTAVPVCDAGLTLSASIGQEGRLTVHLSALESGEHQFTVTLSAPGCSAANAAALAVRVPSPAPVEKKIVVEAQSGAYTGIKGVTHLMKKDGAVTFSVQGLEGVPGVTWKSSKPKRVAIDAVTGEATLKKTGSALITATLPGGGELTLKVKVNKGDFARPESIRLQTKAEGQWTDAPAQGITVVPNERGVKNVPTRLVGGGGKIVIESIQIDTDIATRDGGNPAPVKVKKRFLTDGKTTTLVIRANGREFTLPIAVNSSAKDLYPDEMMAQVQEILQLEED